MFLSHADQDHYDGLVDLLDRFTIGVVHVTPLFGGEANPLAVDLLEANQGARNPDSAGDGTRVVGKRRRIVRGATSAGRLGFGGQRQRAQHRAGSSPSPGATSS